MAVKAPDAAPAIVTAYNWTGFFRVESHNYRCGFSNAKSRRNPKYHVPSGCFAKAAQLIVLGCVS
ncbi:hypothetical protein ACVIWU_002621 [Bradyrhizobium sp. USDA 4509]|uniref:hypothetical protein n=1 Tax=Bradyrhizobium brasilense TaxID=1419277 RepID=UPI0015A41B35|nr:hypothetical protein [Bradyrhizobium brasilense]